MDSPTSKLLIALLALIVTLLVAMAALLYIRYRRRHAEGRTSPVYAPFRSQSATSDHRPSAKRSNSDFLEKERKEFLATTDSPPPSSPVTPEIRITLPDEVDSAGKRQGERTVLVHVGDQSIGFEPYTERHAHYQDSESDRFQSLDMNRIGGLKEKEYT